MRDDKTQSAEFKDSELWKRQRYEGELFRQRGQTRLANEPNPANRKMVSNSLSGNERNRMFLRSEEGFVDVSLVSGTDDMSDGRSFGLLDFDGDGWLDIALMSLNKPRFKLYRNELGSRYSKNQAFRFRLIGGQSDNTPSDQWSSRDAIGARVMVTFASGKTMVMHKQAGEGFATQNSEVLWIGCGETDSVVRLDIRWPSGKTSVVENPDNENVFTIREKD